MLDFVWVGLELFARAGGGGSASGGTSTVTNTLVQAFAVALVVGVLVVFYIVQRQIRLAKKQRMVARFSKTDPKWQEEKLKKRAKEVFMKFQQDWSGFNVSEMESYLTPSMYQHAGYMLAAMHDMERRNDVQRIRLLKQVVLDVHRREGSLEGFFIEMVGQADDSLIDTHNGKTLYTDKSKFKEYWYFVWFEDEWRLHKIIQATQSRRTQIKKLEQFAELSGMYYSADWGWLLLPQRGQLFSKATFKHSDVNNHLIGLYHTQIVQLYSYVPRRGNENIKQYVVAQVTVPKRYGNIVVLRRGWLPIRKPKNMKLTKLQTEWTKFNKKYEIYASDMERATSFELLHPVFMEKLEALPFKVNIEVVDNVVYLYTKDKKANYAVMLAILKDAFKEMKM